MSKKPPACHSPPEARCAIFNLPVEILGEIFVHCLPPGKWGSFSAGDAPWLLTKVCRSWRGLVLSTPLLWSKLPFLSEEEDWEGWQEDGFLQLLELYLKNSAGIALSMGFEIIPDLDDAPFLPPIASHLFRSQHLSIKYYHRFPDQGSLIIHKHFPLLKSLELTCSCFHWTSQSRPTMMGLEGIEFPWAQLTQLTIKISSSAEALTFLRDCSALEMCHLIPSNHSESETPPAPAPETVHPRLRTLIVEDSPFSATVLACLVTPALSTLGYIQSSTRARNPRFGDTSRLILAFIKNSSAKLTSLIMRYVEWPPQNLVDLSTLIPMVTELDLEAFCEEPLRLLAVRSDSPYGVLFPRLARLVIRQPRASESVLPDIFYSRLYLAPNANIIENTSPLQHAELHLLLIGCNSAPTYFGESYQDRPELRGLVSQLQHAYSETAVLGKEILGQAAEVIYRVNRNVFPKQGELGHYEGAFAKQEKSPLLPLPQQSFFTKLDAAFTALEEYQITHAIDILKNKADILMRKFSCVPETAFLHHPTYKFHMRAATLLGRWQPILAEYEAKDKWICERDSTIAMFRLVYRRMMHV